MIRTRNEVLAVNDWLIKIRREIHEHPELGFREFKTAALVERTLKDLGLEVRPGVGGTGVVGDWSAGGDGPVLGLRADMDALPVQEAEGRECRSTVNGVMHACGHDLHTAMLLGAARVLAQNENYGRKLKGRVRFLFQPAEEGGGGARSMLADGAVDDRPLDAVFAAHVAPMHPVGQVGITRGAAMAAADNFYLEVLGRGGHAAHPDLAADPIAPAAGLVMKIKEKTNGFHQALTAVCTFSAGAQNNIIPDRARLGGTIRSLDETDRRRAAAAVRAAALETEAESGLKVNVNLVEGYPVLYNHDGMTNLFMTVAEEMLGGENVIEEGPTYGSEDMAYFLQKAPGALFWLGCGHPDRPDPAMLHSPNFDPDESVLPLGVEMWLRLIEAVLGSEK